MIGVVGATLAGSALAADDVPRFNVRPSCRAAADRVKSSDYAPICVKDELRARDQIEKSWAQFKPADRAHCVQLSTLGGQPTYTELLTCLELARDVRTIHNDNKTPLTAGQAVK